MGKCGCEFTWAHSIGSASAQRAFIVINNGFGGDIKTDSSGRINFSPRLFEIFCGEFHVSVGKCCEGFF